MVHTCCVPHCKAIYASSQKTSMFSFPKEEPARTKWISALSITGKRCTPKLTLRVCEAHFRNKDIQRESIFVGDSGETIKVPLARIRLVPGAIPLIGPSNILDDHPNRIKEAKVVGVEVKKEVIASDDILPPLTAQEYCIKEELFLVKNVRNNVKITINCDKADKLELKKENLENQTTSSAQHAPVCQNNVKDLDIEYESSDITVPAVKKEKLQFDECSQNNVHEETVVAEPIELKSKHILNNKSFTCDKCFFRCNSKIKLCTHKRKHREVNDLFACDKCLYKSKSKQILTKHKCNHHMVRKFFACDQCSYKSIRLSDLVTHNFSHTGIKKYTCDLCSYSYYQRSHLVLHKLTHHRKAIKKFFSCDKCAFICNDKYTLISHKESHSREATFSCDLCTYSSSWEGSLVSHTLSMH